MVRTEDAEYLVYRVREVKPHDRRDGKETVFLSSGMSGFTADAGAYEEGDLVAVSIDGNERAVGLVHIEEQR